MEGATAPQSLLLDLRKLEGDYNHFFIGLKYLKTLEAICLSSEARLMMGRSPALSGWRAGPAQGCVNLSWTCAPWASGTDPARPAVWFI